MLSFIRSLFFGTKAADLGEKQMVSTNKKTKLVISQRVKSIPTKQVVLLEAIAKVY
jgi:hypothetical protein